MLKTRMSASYAAGSTYLLKTNTGTSYVSEFCVITEQNFDLIGCRRIAGMVILRSLKGSHSAAQSSFASNAFVMLLSISITSGPG